MSNSTHNEKQLLLQVAQGSQSAYKQLYLLYWDRLYSIAFMFTKSPELSEDITQDVFARVWINREKLAELEKFESYLFIVARNMVYDTLKKNVYTTKYQEYFEQYFSDPALTPGDRTEFKQFEDLIEQGIRTLPLKQQQAFRLSRFNGLKHEQIAAEMGISRMSVKSHIVRAIAALRKYLEDHRGEIPLFIWILFFL